MTTEARLIARGDLYTAIRHDVTRRGATKRDLLARLSRSMRVHALSERDGFRTIIEAIVDAELPLPRERR